MVVLRRRCRCGQSVRTDRRSDRHRRHHGHPATTAGRYAGCWWASDRWCSRTSVPHRVRGQPEQPGAWLLDRGAAGVDLWNVSISLIKENPISGYGFGRSSAPCPRICCSPPGASAWIELRPDVSSRQHLARHHRRPGHRGPCHLRRDLRHRHDRLRSAPLATDPRAVDNPVRDDAAGHVELFFSSASEQQAWPGR